MPTLLSPMDPNNPREERLRPAVEVLRSGGVVSLPTETFYGLAVDAFDREALGRLNALKGKPAGSPILLLLAEREEAGRVAGRLPEAFEALASMFWPGPLTLVVPAGRDLPPEVSGGRGTVGIRVPGLPLPRRLAAAFGGPITGVSANLTGHPPCRTALEVSRAFPAGIGMILDGGASTGGAPSTVLDLTGPIPAVIREGAIPLSSLRPFLRSLRRNSV